MAQALQGFEKIGHRIEAQSTLAECATPGYFGAQGGIFFRAEEDPLTEADLPSGMDQALPLVRLLGDLAGQQHLDLALEKSLCRRITGANGLRPGPGASAEEPGRKHACVVQNQQIVRAEKIWKICELTVTKCARAPVQMQHSGGSPLREGFLGNQFGG